MTSVAISVVIPCRNAAETLPKALTALAAQSIAQPFEVIVVDNGSSDGSPYIAEHSALNVQVVRQRNLGPGAARNAGVAAAHADLIAFTDADCEPAKDWLERGAAALESADLVQGAVAPDPSARRGPFDRSVWVGSDLGLHETANLFVRRERFEQAGGFSGWLDPTGNQPFGEDTDLGWRMRRAGTRFVFIPELLVHHAVFARGPSGPLRDAWRRRHFPALIRHVPELRAQSTFGRIFLTLRSATFDLALGSTIVMAATGVLWMLVGALPYVVIALRRAWRWRRRAPQVLIIDFASDATTLAALLCGSLRHRTVVL